MKTAKSTIEAASAVRSATVADAIRADLAAGDAGYRAAGEKFRAEKKAHPGKFLAWLEKEGFSVRSAQRYMAFADTTVVSYSEWLRPDDDLTIQDLNDVGERTKKPEPEEILAKGEASRAESGNDVEATPSKPPLDPLILKAQTSRRALAVEIIEAGCKVFEDETGTDYVRDQLLTLAEKVR